MSDSPACPYTEVYFLRGKETGLSLYENYHWMPDLTMPMCQAIARYLGFCRDNTILDFGCARGYTVKALRLLWFKAYGIDCSPWAIENCDPAAKDFVSREESVQINYDWIIAKDVLEHVERLQETIDSLMEHAKIGLFVVVPLGVLEYSLGHKYVIPEYELDVTHIHRLKLSTWAELFVRPGWEITASYRVPGVKDNWYKPGWEEGNGFITARRQS